MGDGEGGAYNRTGNCVQVDGPITRGLIGGSLRFKEHFISLMVVTFLTVHRVNLIRTLLQAFAVPLSASFDPTRSRKHKKYDKVLH